MPLTIPRIIVGLRYANPTYVFRGHARFAISLCVILNEVKNLAVVAAASHAAHRRQRHEMAPLQREGRKAKTLEPPHPALSLFPA